MIRFIRKRKAEEISAPVSKMVVAEPVVEVKAEKETIDKEQAKAEPTKAKKNKKQVIKEDMDFETIKALESEMTPEQKTKKIKSDKGLIERAESSKTIITEDHKQLMLD